MRIVILFVVTLCLHVSALRDVKAQGTWEVTLSGGDLPIVFSMSCAGPHCSACGYDSSNYRIMIWHSSDSGHFWTAQNPGLDPAISFNSRVNVIDQIDSATSYAAGYHQATSGVIDSAYALKTTNEGIDWTREHLPVTAKVHGLASIHFVNSSEGIGVGGNLIFLTSNGGDSWDTLPSIVWNGAITCHAFGSGKFTVLSGYHFYNTDDYWHSVDSGYTLPIFINGLKYAWKSCVFSHDTIWTYGFSLNAASTTAIARSTDKGGTWETTLFDAAIGNISCMSAPMDNTIIAGSTNQAAGNSYGKAMLLRSSDAGATWYVDSSCFTLDGQLFIRSISIMPTGDVLALFTGFAFQPSIIARFTPSLSSVHEEVAVNALLYPNPAHDIIFSETGFEGLPKVLDVMGRLQTIKSLHSSIDISHLTPGAYYITNGWRRQHFFKQ